MEYCETCGESKEASCHDIHWCDGEFCEFTPADEA